MRTIHPFLFMLLPVLAGLIPLVHRFLRQRWCRHDTLAMDPSGRALCLKCWKKLFR